MESNNLLPTDEQLLNKYLTDPDGESGRQAADVLLSRYHSRVFQWCRGYFRNPDDALDSAQEALINGYRGLRGFDQRSQFSSWLFVITRNVCLTAVRRQHNTNTSLENIPEPFSKESNVEEKLEASQEGEAWRMLLGSNLKPEEEEAFWLRIVEKMSLEQITRILRLENASGARSVLQNARRKLRSVWGNRIDQFKGVE